MKSTRELAVVNYERKYKEKVGLIEVLPEWAINDLDYIETTATVVALPDHYGDFPSTLKVGDTVRMEYGTMDDKNPIELEGEGLFYHAHLSEILYKIHEDGTPEMQHGWVLGQGLPVPKPEEAVSSQTVNGIAYWKNAMGFLYQKVDFAGMLNRMRVCGFGLPKPSLGEIPYELEDIVYMEDDCEFTNHNNNTILGNKYWFVRQEDIIAVAK
jgi:hypothetical protein